MQTVEVVGKQMGLMDEDGNVLDAVVLTSRRKAVKQIQRWAAEFTINVADAYHTLDAALTS